MDANKILSADLLDLIFDDRNKDYGAYDLRKSYQRRIKKSLVITFSVALVITTGSVLAGTLKPSDDQEMLTKRELIIEAIEEVPEEPEPLPEPERLPEPEPVRTEMFTQPDIVDDNQVQEPPPSQDDLDKAKIDVFDVDSDVLDTGIEDPKPVDKGTGIIEKKKPSDDEIYTGSVDVQSRFIGDWGKFLRKNLNAQTPVDNGAGPGSYKVLIKFVVDVEGNVSNITPVTSIGYGMEEEAVRVLKKATKWEPAVSNGYKVKAYHIQQITFEVLEE